MACRDLLDRQASLVTRVWMDETDALEYLDYRDRKVKLAEHVQHVCLAPRERREQGVGTACPDDLETEVDPEVWDHLDQWEMMDYQAHPDL